jgi:hypothetical protein
MWHQSLIYPPTEQAAPMNLLLVARAPLSWFEELLCTGQLAVAA